MVVKSSYLRGIRMRIKLKFATILSVLLLSCVTAAVAQPQFESLVNKEDVVLNKDYIEKWDDYESALKNCLWDAFAKEYARHKEMNVGSSPTLQAAFYERQCIAAETDYYIAIYSVYKMARKDLNESRLHEKADEAVKFIKEYSFDALTDKYRLLD